MLNDRNNCYGRFSWFFTESLGMLLLNYDLAVHLICDFMMSSAIKSFGQAFLKSLRSREAEPFVARRNGRNPLMLQKAQDGFRKPSPGGS